MRILYHHRIASRDGQATHVEEMIKALRETGHEVSECGPRVYQRDTGAGSSPGWVGLLKKALPQLAYEAAELAYSGLSYYRVCRAVREFRPDAIYERYALYNLGGLWASRRYGLPLLLEVNSPQSVQRRGLHSFRWGALGDWCEKYAWKNSSRVLPVTNVLAQFIRDAGVPDARIRVIGNAVNLADYQGLPAPEAAKAALGFSGRTVVGFTGFVCEWDRLDRVVRWLATYRGPADVHLLIVGDGPVRGALEALATELGVAAKVSFTGVLPRRDVPRYAMAFDVALQMALVPYASPLCLFEYLALGKAIVAPHQPNHLEILRDRIDAVLYDPADPGDLEGKIELLVGDPALRSRLGAAASQTIEARGYTWQANAKRVSEEIVATRQELGLLSPVLDAAARESTTHGCG